MITKYVKSDPTEIQIPNIVYSPFQNKLPDDTGCGSLIHEIETYSYLEESFPHLVTTNEDDLSQVQRSSNNYLSWYLDASTADQIGTHQVQMRFYPEDVEAAPVENYPVFELNILPCYVWDVALGNEDLIDFEMSLDETVVLPFSKFAQVPACDYSVEYTLTLIKRTSTTEPAAF